MNLLTGTVRHEELTRSDMHTCMPDVRLTLTPGLMCRRTNANQAKQARCKGRIRVAAFLPPAQADMRYCRRHCHTFLLCNSPPFFVHLTCASNIRRKSMSTFELTEKRERKVRSLKEDPFDQWLVSPKRRNTKEEDEGSQDLQISFVVREAAGLATPS